MLPLPLDRFTSGTRATSGDRKAIVALGSGGRVGSLPTAPEDRAGRSGR